MAQSGVSVATILARNLNRNECAEAAAIVDRCLAGQGNIPRLVLDDFDVSAWEYDPADNSWMRKHSDGIHWRLDGVGDV